MVKIFILLAAYLCVSIYIGFFPIDKETYGIGIQCGDLLLLCIVWLLAVNYKPIRTMVVAISILTLFKLFDVLQYKLTLNGISYYNDILMILITFTVAVISILRKRV